MNQHQKQCLPNYIVQKAAMDLQPRGQSKSEVTAENSRWEASFGEWQKDLGALHLQPAVNGTACCFLKVSRKQIRSKQAIPIYY